MTGQMTGSKRPVASWQHTVGLIALVVFWAWNSYVGVAHLHVLARPLLLLIYARTLLLEWATVGFIVIGVRRYGGTMRELIGGRWERIQDFGRDVLIALGFWISALVILSVLRIALHSKGSVAALRVLAPRSPFEMAAWLFVAASAGFCEEIIFRGYLQRQFIAASGQPWIGIALSAVIFGGVHAYQGAKQTVLLGAFGLMFGLLAYRRNSLRPGMMAHAWQDSLAGIALRLLPK